MKKKLNVDAMINELREGSVFFRVHPDTKTLPADDTPETQAALPEPSPIDHQAMRIEDKNESSQASMIAIYPDDLIEVIRKRVKATGKEVSYVRVTTEEKEDIVDIEYTLRRQKVATSENEIYRIALSYLLEDYKASGEQSVLARVLAALRA